MLYRASDCHGSLAQDRVQHQALVNTVMKIRVKYESGNSLAEWLSASEERFCFMGLLGVLSDVDLEFI